MGGVREENSIESFLTVANKFIAGDAENNAEILKKIEADVKKLRATRETLELKEQVRVQRKFGDQAPLGKWDKIRFEKTVAMMNELVENNCILDDNISRLNSQPIGDSFTFRYLHKSRIRTVLLKQRPCPSSNECRGHYTR